MLLKQAHFSFEIVVFSSAYPHIQVRCILRPVQRLSTFFRFKDRILLGLRSRVVYKFKCQCCDALYFGETIHHLHTRISEHMGISACTGKSLSKSSFSNILSHHQSSGHPIDPDDFSILTSCSSTFELIKRVYLSLNFNHRLMPIFDLYLWPCINSLLFFVCVYLYICNVILSRTLPPEL